MPVKKMKSMLLLALAALSSQALCAAPEWQMQPKDSTLTFTATQNDAPVSGAFKAFDAKIVFDPDNLKDSSIAIVVDVNSVSLSYAEAQNTLKTADWFNVKLFPKAEFRASQWKRISDKAFQAVGTLTIRDKTLPVTLDFTTEKLAENKGQVAGSTTIKRTAFGVGQGDWASTSEIKDDVKVNFKVTAILKK